MTDLMIDLETLGTSTDSVVLSIGAVFFDVETKTIGPKFYRVLEIEDQTIAGRKIDGDTLKWWMSQSEGARNVFSAKSSIVTLALGEFNAWIYKNEIKDYSSIPWGNGATFDISIMEHLLQQYARPIPWKFYNIMDLRTFKRFKANGSKVIKSGVDHNALDDAIAQAQYVLDNT